MRDEGLKLNSWAPAVPLSLPENIRPLSMIGIAANHAPDNGGEPARPTAVQLCCSRASIQWLRHCLAPTGSSLERDEPLLFPCLRSSNINMTQYSEKARGCQGLFEKMGRILDKKCRKNGGDSHWRCAAVRPGGATPMKSVHWFAPPHAAKHNKNCTGQTSLYGGASGCIRYNESRTNAKGSVRKCLRRIWPCCAA